LPANGEKGGRRPHHGAAKSAREPGLRAPGEAQHKPPFNRPLILIAVALFIATALYLKLRIPMGIPGEWQRAYHSEYAPISSIALFAAASCAFLLAAFFAERFAARASTLARGAVAAALAAAYGIVLFSNVVMGPAGRIEFVAPAVEWDACGLFGREAQKITSARQYLADFPRLLKEYKANYVLTVRVNNNPPGTTMLFYAARRLTQSSRAIADFVYGSIYGWDAKPPNDQMPGVVLGAWLLLIGAALSFVPAYLVASRLTGRPAFFAAAVALLAVSMLLFNPDNDTLQVMLFLWMTYFFLRGVAGRPVVWGAAFGLIAALAFFFTLATSIVVITLFLWAVALSMTEEKHSYGRDSVFWAAAAGGLAAGFGLFYVTLHYDSLTSLYACYVNHREFYAYYPRRYLKWVLYNVWEFVMFLGGPLSAAVIWYAGARPSLAPRSPENRRARAFVLATLAVLVALDLSGKNLSEVNRLWVFFMPLFALPALTLVRRDAGGTMTLWALGLLQMVNVIVVRFYVDVWRVENFLREMEKYIPR
jgi:hypothetical protein